ncbi:MAG TPA: phosphoribosylanthranilate isomerase [Planctomycetota bacterium]|nr:phosphoribosylanthranilate isomerase [Planctomycetota bacterium]
MSPRIKICGVKRAEHVLAAANAGAAAVGLNFVPSSSRFIGRIENAWMLIDACSMTGVEWAGVFVNPEFDELLRLKEELGLHVLQLHGDESPEFVRRVKARAGDARVWKAFHVAAQSELAAINDYECDGVLLDTKVSGAHGGTGRTFDWKILEGFKRSVPLILSGGLNARNVADAIRAAKPDWVDVASGVEIAPGEKSVALIVDFIRAANSGDRR